MRRAAACSALILCSMNINAVPVLEGILASLPASASRVVQDSNRYQLQVIYTRIDRDRTNHPSFATFSYRLDPQRYFYPASLVKLPMAVLALDKLNSLGIPGVDRFAPVRIPAALGCQTPQSLDETTLGGPSTLGTYISRMLSVSDNLSFNRVYEFVGRDLAATNLDRWGLGRIVILHRLAACDTQQNRYTSPVAFLRNDQSLAYEQPPLVSTLPLFNPLGNPVVGRAHREHGVLIPTPLECGSFSYAALEDLHRLLMGVIFPSSFASRHRPFLTADDYRFLRTAMSIVPGETGVAALAGYPDNYKKYLLYGDGTMAPRASLRSYNVVGRAYGFLADVAYIADFEHRIEFFLSAVIYANEDDVVNDDRYDYDAVGLPFLSELGKAVYAYERGRRRRHPPDLTGLLPDLTRLDR